MNTSFLNSSAHYEAHKNYLRGVDLENCRHFALVEPHLLCQYVKVTEPCTEGVTLLNYAEIIFCELPSYTEITLPKAVLILSVFCFFYVLLMVILTLTLIPNMLYLIQQFGLSQHSAASTIVVLIYGTPDIFSTLIQFHDDVELLINEMMGISLYLRAFLSGLLICCSPLALYATFFIRDAIIFGFSLILLYYIVVNQTEKTSIFEGILAVTFFPSLCYLTYLQHFSTEEARRRAETKQLPEEEKINLELTKEMTLISFPLPSGVKDPLTLKIFPQFLLVANPFNAYNFKHFNCWQKFVLIIGFYFTIIVKLVTPVVHPMVTGYAWSKLLIAINMFLSILLICIVSIRHIVYSIPVVLFGIFHSIFFLLSARTDTPSLQLWIACYGIVFEVWAKHYCEAEINTILLLIGNILGFKRTVTGCTLLSWSDCVPEIVAVVTFSGWKLGTIPFVAFFDAPLFNMIFSIGLQVLKQSIKKRSIYVPTRAGDVGQTCTWFTLVHHCVFCFATLCTGFRLRRSVGIYSIIVYLLFLLYLVLNQRDIIHAFGTDHINEDLFEDIGWA